MWTSVMIESCHRLREGWAHHQAVLTFEPDCVPLRADWISALELEWIKRRPATIVGHLHDEGYPSAHINGNAIFSATLAQDYPGVMTTAYMGSWDFANRELFLKIGVDTDLIYQLYGLKTIAEEDFIRIRKHEGRPALLHGVKDRSAQEWARKHVFRHPLSLSQSS
jgi:hypothetical protein